MADPIPTITRPNGRAYRPRKIVAACWDNEGAYDRDDWAGCVIFGTHDIERARPLADEACRYFHGTRYAIKPVRVWWRDGFEYGERLWIDDELRGRAGVRFVASDDPEGDDDGH